MVRVGHSDHERYDFGHIFGRDLPAAIVAAERTPWSIQRCRALRS
jgi:hypothetical protein